jgi:hypothetical protein
MAMWLAAVAAPPDDQVQPGWLGFFVVLALGIVTYLLWRSMNTHLKRVNFDTHPSDGEGQADEALGTPDGSGAEGDGEQTDDGLPDSTKRPDS